MPTVGIHLSDELAEVVKENAAKTHRGKVSSYLADIVEPALKGSGNTISKPDSATALTNLARAFHPTAAAKLATWAEANSMDQPRFINLLLTDLVALIDQEPELSHHKVRVRKAADIDYVREALSKSEQYKRSQS